MTREETMSLKDILEKIVEEGARILLSDRNKDWEASILLENLSEPMLKRRAHLQPGLYIAEINDSGYLGQVLYRVKQKA
ncbi:hypothetical protein ES703_30324 [subsurface metagenome]